MREININEEIIEKVCSIISQVSFKGSDTKVPSTIEGQIVQDADRLDAIGAIAIARAFSYGGAHSRPMYDPEILPIKNMDAEKYYSNKGTTLNHFYEKLLLLKDLINTKTAKKIANNRHLYMENFINEFLKEWNGEI